MGDTVHVPKLRRLLELFLRAIMVSWFRSTLTQLSRTRDSGRAPPRRRRRRRKRDLRDLSFITCVKLLKFLEREVKSDLGHETSDLNQGDKNLPLI